MSRKTTNIAALIDEVNRRNQLSTCSAEERRGWNSLLETVLHSNGVYNGFNNYPQDRVPKGHKPGIVFGDVPANNQFPDDTRRFYYADRAFANQIKFNPFKPHRSDGSVIEEKLDLEKLNARYTEPKTCPGHDANTDCEIDPQNPCAACNAAEDAALSHRRH